MRVVQYFGLNVMLFALCFGRVIMTETEQDATENGEEEDVEYEDVYEDGEYDEEEDSGGTEQHDGEELEIANQKTVKETDDQLKPAEGAEVEFDTNEKETKVNQHAQKEIKEAEHEVTRKHIEVKEEQQQEKGQHDVTEGPQEIMIEGKQKIKDGREKERTTDSEEKKLTEITKNETVYDETASAIKTMKQEHEKADEEGIEYLEEEVDKDTKREANTDNIQETQPQEQIADKLLSKQHIDVSELEKEAFIEDEGIQHTIHNPDKKKSAKEGQLKAKEIKQKTKNSGKIEGKNPNKNIKSEDIKKKPEHKNDFANQNPVVSDQISTVARDKKPQGKPSNSHKSNHKAEGENNKNGAQLEDVTEDFKISGAVNEDGGKVEALIEDVENSRCDKNNYSECQQEKSILYEFIKEEHSNGDEKADKTDSTSSGKLDDNNDTNKKGFQQSQELLKKKNIMYEEKMKDLEMQLLKLENQIIMETLSRSNNSAIFSKLENHILKLENELLKLNQNINQIYEENEKLKRKQQFQAKDLAKVKETTDKSENPMLPDLSSEISSSISRHQNKIVEMKSSIKKLSTQLESLDKRSKSIEKENFLLQQQLMKQSLAMAEMMATIEAMSRQQQAQAKQIEIVKAVTEDLKGTSDQIIKKTENCVDKTSLEALRYAVKEQQKQTEMKVAEEITKIQNTQPNINTMVSDKQAESKSREKNVVKSKSASKAAAKKAGNKVVSSKSNTAQSKTVKKAKSKTKPPPPVKVTVKSVKNAKTQTKKQASPKTKTTHTTVKSPPSKKVIKNPKQPSKAPKASKTQQNPRKHAATKQPVKKLPPTKAKQPLVNKPEVKQTVNNSPVKTDYPPPTPKYFDADYKYNKDCFDYFLKGRKRDTSVKVRPKGSSKNIEVWCDMKNGGWTLIQKRQDGRTDFFRDWKEYKNGFGAVMGEHWLGLENIHLLTNQNYYSLRIDMMDWDRKEVYAEYEVFTVEDEDQGYRLYLSGYKGTAGDGFANHSGMKFSTKDVDNDLAQTDFNGSCAQRFNGANWYHKCYKSNLNGKYYKDGIVAENAFDGVSWKPWKSPTYSLKKVEMKIRPRDAAKIISK